MIQRLQIKNYAIIDELNLDFDQGLTIITGETGAGKSILLGALGLIMGKRADTKVLYHEDKKCIVEATFLLSKYSLKGFFEKNDIDYEDETHIRRELTPSGKSRAFINDTPVNLKVLQQLSGSLIDLHQQFDTLDIHSVSFQLRMLDALAGNNELLNKYQKGYRHYQADQRRLEELREQNARAARESDFFQFQLNEFNEAELIPGEQEKQEQELNRLTNAEDIKRTLVEVYRSLNESDPSVVGQLQDLVQAITAIHKYEIRLEPLSRRFQGLLVELEDLAAEFEQLAESTEYDAERIPEIQSRLDMIYKLQNKHHVNDVEALLEIQEKLEQQLTQFADLSEEISSLEKDLEQQKKTLTAMALELSSRRKAVIDNFVENVHQLLGQLAMENAQLKIEVNELEKLSPTGLDDVQYLFAPNKGSRFLPIKDVASGGEISRLTLCTKSLVASAIPLPTLIFDEIDTGISGDVALKMGNILRDLAKQHQVVTITHTPQVAVKANRHYFVHKKDKEDRTVTSVKLLSEEDRVQAVAQMLSGNPPTASAIENAKELLGRV